MSNEERYVVIGVQNDGEPAVVEPVKPVDPPPEPKPVDPPAEDGADPVDPPAVDGEEEGSEDHPKRLSGSARQKLKAERERDERVRLETENRLLREQLAGTKPAGEPEKAPAPSGAPKDGDFEDHDDYLVAKAKFEIRQEDEARVRKTQEDEAKTSWNAKVEAGRKKFDDFDDALKGAVAPSLLVSRLLVNDRTPVEVLYHLATHPDEYQSINALTDPYEVGEAMALLKVKLAAPVVPPKPKTPSAPPPIVPLAGTSTVVPPKRRTDTYVEIK